MRFAVAVVAAILILVCSFAADVGFRQIEIPDPPSKPLAIGISYPSSSHASSQPLCPFHQDVALNGTIDETKHPVIFISHGTGGSLASHCDTALGKPELNSKPYALS
jgi:hypothetical protein